MRLLLQEAARARERLKAEQALTRRAEILAQNEVTLARKAKQVRINRRHLGYAALRV